MVGVTLHYVQSVAPPSDVKVVMSHRRARRLFVRQTTKLVSFVCLYPSYFLLPSVIMCVSLAFSVCPSLRFLL